MVKGTIILLQLMNNIKPVPHPEFPTDYPLTVLTTMLNDELLSKQYLGFSWIRSARLHVLKDFSFIGLIKFAIMDYKYKKVMNKNLKKLSE